MANRYEERGDYPQGRWDARRGDGPRMSDRYRDEDDDRGSRAGYSRSEFDDRAPDRRYPDRDHDDRGSREWQGGGRHAGDMRRREWDPGNYGGLDQERGPGRAGGMSGGMSGGGRQSAGSPYGGWDSDPWGGGNMGGQFQSGGFGGGFGGGYAPGNQGSYPGQGGQQGGQMQRESGPHRGKGPKGYTRSDDRIREEVSDRLSDNDMIDASDISVEVSGGEVTLEGYVSSRSARRAAEDCCESCSGVSHVQNNLRVRESGSSNAGTGQGNSNAMGQKARGKDG